MFYYDRTCWMLLQKGVVRSELDMYVLHSYHWVDTSVWGLHVSSSIIRPVVTASALTWFIMYIWF